MLEEIAGHAWAFVVLDMNLAGHDGLDVLKRVKVTRPHIPIVVFSLYSERQYAARTLRAGAKAYLSKERPPQDLVDTVQEILSGRRVTSSSNFQRSALSDREVQVLSFLTQGMAVKDIAGFLQINQKTVSTYRARLMKKLNLRSIVDLIHYGAKEGFVE